MRVNICCVSAMQYQSLFSGLVLFSSPLFLKYWLFFNKNTYGIKNLNNNRVFPILY